jgi:hypothetical protein
MRESGIEASELIRPLRGIYRRCLGASTQIREIVTALSEGCELSAGDVCWVLGLVESRLVWCLATARSEHRALDGVVGLIAPLEKTDAESTATEFEGDMARAIAQAGLSGFYLGSSEAGGEVRVRCALSFCQSPGDCLSLGGAGWQPGGNAEPPDGPAGLTRAGEVWAYSSFGARSSFRDVGLSDNWSGCIGVVPDIRSPRSSSAP